MQSVVPLACFLSIIRPPGVQYENALLQVAPVDKSKCPFVKDSSDIGFQLFTRHNPTAYQELQLGDDERLFASNMDFGAPTVFYFHAFMEQPDDGSGIMVREAYMQRGDTNVIMVDAHRLEAGPWYFTAAQNTWYIGRFAAAFIDYMVSRGLQLNSTQLVGHSLGAQAAGVAGSALTTGRVARITGLDPALPLFSGLPLEQRLDASDAAFVDVIHTDAGIFGYKEPIGHADFFPNGGRSPQPGCELEVVIPQQLLLNKCDGTEQTRGFYSYYLTSQSHTEQQHDSRGHYALKQIKPRPTGSKRKRVDSSRVETKELDRNSDILRARPRKHLQKKSTIHIEVHDVSHATPRSSRRRNKRDQRSGSTAVADAEHQAAHAASDHTDTEGEGLAAPRDHTDTTTDVTGSETIRRSTPDGNDMKLPNSGLHASSKASTTSDAPKHALKRQKRFLQLFSRSDGEDNFIFRALNFLAKNRKRVVPIVSVVRDISTLVRSANGELNHVAKETNQYVGVAPPPPPAPLAYSLELANESKLAAFVKRLLGLAPRGDRLTVGGG